MTPPFPPPFPPPGCDTGNDTAFMNETIRDWCAAAAVEFTRSRPCRKIDQAHVEQGNSAVVRRMMDWRTIAPGKSTQNPFAESVQGRMHDECHNERNRPIVTAV